MKKRWRDDVMISGVFFLFYLALGGYMTLFRHYMPYDALGRLVSAWLVVTGTEVKLASIGFVWPPIPTLLAIPFTVIPALVESWMAMVILSAIFMALSVWAVYQLAETCEIPGGWRAAVALLFGLTR